MLTKTISIPQYECIIKLILDEDIDAQIQKKFKKKGFTPDGSKYEGMILTDNPKEYYFFLSLKYLSFNLIGHEIDHLCDLIQEDRGIEDMENRGWIAGYIHAQVYDFVISKDLPLKINKGNKCQSFKITKI